MGCLISHVDCHHIYIYFDLLQIHLKKVKIILGYLKFLVKSTILENDYQKSHFLPKLIISEIFGWIYMKLLYFGFEFSSLILHILLHNNFHSTKFEQNRYISVMLSEI